MDLPRKTLLLSTAYLGPVAWFKALVSGDNVFIDKEEHYIKQSYRNRCNILTANGIQPLTIPVIKIHGNHTKVKDILIDYSQKWQHLHWSAICSAYNRSPFFLYYKDLLEPYYYQKTEGLLEFNLKLTFVILGSLNLKKEIRLTDNFTDGNDSDIIDRRNSIHPKKKQPGEFKSYIQVFSDRFPFEPNLSIIDLLFCEGPHAIDYL